MRPQQLMLPLCLVLVMLGTARAQPAPPKPLAPLGTGIDSCKTWLFNHQHKRAQAKIQDDWLAGFLTGYNTYVTAKDRPVSYFRFDMETLPSAITAQCKLDLDGDVYSEALKFLELQKGMHTTVAAH